MSRAARRQLNQLFNHRLKAEMPRSVVNGTMGDRDPNTGRYRMRTLNGGTVATHFIGTSNSAATTALTEIDLSGWGDR